MDAPLALFENIAENIQQEIKKAEHSIYIAVAWFTNREIFEELVFKAKKGISVNLMVSNDSINKDSSIEFERLNIQRSKVYFIGDGEKELMHHKFCVIDRKTVITGSYNWSYKAEKNFENIVITTGDETLSEQFIVAFNNIQKQYFPKTVDVIEDLPIDKIVKRLEIIKNYILLEDIEELETVSFKLIEFCSNLEINFIVECIKHKRFTDAVTAIEKFITDKQKISIWIDPEIETLKLEIKILENQIVSFDNEKAELDGILRDFQREHYMAVGDLILKLLKLRKLKYAQDKDKFMDAEADEKEYKEQFEREKEKDIVNLSEEEKKELKSCYRKAALLCHPDKFSQAPAEIQKQAEELMTELALAEDRKDLKRVKKILKDLENGIISSRKIDESNDKLKLKNLVNKLRDKLAKIEQEILDIKLSKDYKLICEIENWAEYFSNVKQQISNEIDLLKTEIETLESNG